MVCRDRYYKLKPVSSTIGELYSRHSSQHEGKEKPPSRKRKAQVAIDDEEEAAPRSILKTKASLPKGKSVHFYSSKSNSKRQKQEKEREARRKKEDQEDPEWEDEESEDSEAEDQPPLDDEQEKELRSEQKDLQKSTHFHPVPMAHEQHQHQHQHQPEQQSFDYQHQPEQPYMTPIPPPIAPLPGLSAEWDMFSNADRDPEAKKRVQALLLGWRLGTAAASRGFPCSLDSQSQ